MARGKAWTVDEELKLKELPEAGLPVPIIASKLSKTELAVTLKVSRLGLKDDKKGEKSLSSSSGELELPAARAFKSYLPNGLVCWLWPDF